MKDLVLKYPSCSTGNAKTGRQQKANQKSLKKIKKLLTNSKRCAKLNELTRKRNSACTL